MGPPNAGLQHAAAPDRNGVIETVLLDFLRFTAAGNAAQFDVNDLARSQLNRSLSIAQAMNAFVQADGCLQLPLQLRMLVDLIPFQAIIDLLGLGMTTLAKAGAELSVIILVYVTSNIFVPS
jgi:hypothetical protein